MRRALHNVFVLCNYAYIMHEQCINRKWTENNDNEK